jgi:hypothetical protein
LLHPIEDVIARGENGFVVEEAKARRFYETGHVDEATCAAGFRVLRDCGKLFFLIFLLAQKRT